MEDEEIYTNKILVIEDDTILCELIAKNLERSGFEVLKAQTGESALSLMREGEDYILIVDYHLPDMTGKELIKSNFIKENKVPFIIMTGHGDEKLAVEMMKQNARDYIVKDNNFLEILPSVVQHVMHQVNMEKRLAKAEEFQKDAEKKLSALNEELEVIVQERTAQLEKVNKELLREIAERREIERRLEDYNKELQLFAEISSELVSNTVENANRMKNLLNELLSYAKLGIDANYFQNTETSVALGNALYELRHLIEECSAEITYDRLPNITADTAQITILFRNLIENSILSCCDKTPRIHISAREDEKEWIFSITSNSPAIDTEYKEMIFTIFSHLQTCGSSSRSGIGLATCKKIVEGHSGNIWLESNNDNESIFYFSIPKRHIT
ncbi:MAG: response regulator [Candidatus Poribacteria bacterium]